MQGQPSRCCLAAGFTRLMRLEVRTLPVSEFSDFKPFAAHCTKEVMMTTLTWNFQLRCQVDGC